MVRRAAEVARSIPKTLGRVDTRAYIPELDGLRCLAIMFVLVWHAALRAARHIDHVNSSGGVKVGNYFDLFPHGEIGVILFFFISGFVVSQPFVGRPRAQWKIGEFYKRRFMRIYPPYLIAMTLCFVVLGVVGHKPADANAFREATISLRDSFLASLVYMHDIVFNIPSPLNPPMWSLEIEVLFYAVLPLVMLAYCSHGARGARIGVMCGIIGTAILVSSLLLHSLDTDLRLRWGLFYHAYLFLTGIVVADIVGDASKRSQAKSGIMDAVFVGGIAVIVYIGLLMTQNDARMLGSLYALKIQALTIVSIILIFYGAFHGRWASMALSLSWVRLIGTMCYSIYLTHIVVMTALGEVLSRIVHTHDRNLIYLIYLCVLVSASLIAGTVFYVFVERPFARRLVRPRSARAGSGRPEVATAPIRSAG